MDDTVRTAIGEGETPVNPYSLLEALNGSSRTARTGWLLFLGIMGYLFIAVAGVTRADLLMARDVLLPILQVKIGMTSFFLLAPMLLVMFHAGLMTQLAGLSRKALELDAAVRMLEVTDQRRHPLRLELSNFFLVQSLAGPERSRIMSLFLNIVAWLTLIVLPVALLLYIEATFLPVHDIAVTWVQRIAVLSDLAMLALLGVFLVSPETSFFAAVRRAIRCWPVRSAFLLALLGGAAGISLAVATVPGEPLDRVLHDTLGAGGEGRSVGGTSKADSAAASLAREWLGLLRRNLDLADAGLPYEPGKPGAMLRHRDLRHARLDRIDLRHADFTGADLTGANLVEANLEGALLTGATLAGASFAGANLQRAGLSAVSAPGADFSSAALQGADLSGGRFAGATFTLAGLQGASLAQAVLYGAIFRDADFEGGNASGAALQGADLSGAKLRAVDLRSATVWLTAVPDRGAMQLADLTGLRLQPPGEPAIAEIATVIDRLDAPSRAQLGQRLGTLLNADASRNWSAADQQVWQDLIQAAAEDGYKIRLSDHLGQLVCKMQWRDGAVAAGVVRRALSQGFQGELPVLYDRLRAADCTAAVSVPPRLLSGLGAAADRARGK